MICEEFDLSNLEVQNILKEYLWDLPLFSSIMDKGKRPSKRKIHLYFNDNEFIGYIIKVEDNKTININNIEIRRSIRKNPNNQRWGKIIMIDFLNNYKSNITLMALTDWHIEYYKNYGFRIINENSNKMIRCQ